MFGSRRRDAAAADRLTAATATARAYGLTPARVQRVYQRGHRGSKAVLYLVDHRAWVDAWFWWYQVDPGSIVFIRPGVGWGPHTQRDNVHYVGERDGHRHGVHGVVPRREVHRADRHYRRQARAAQRR